jgi:hypothetical protein
MSSRKANDLHLSVRSEDLPPISGLLRLASQSEQAINAQRHMWLTARPDHGRARAIQMLQTARYKEAVFKKVTAVEEIIYRLH